MFLTVSNDLETLSNIVATSAQAFENSMLPGLDFPLHDVQPLWNALGGVGAFIPSTLSSALSAAAHAEMEAEDADDEGD